MLFWAKEDDISKKTLLLIAGVVLILTAATSAQAYYEKWDGWLSSGNLYYGGYTYVKVGSSGAGEAKDSTYTAGVKDTFYGFTPNVGGLTFVCSMLSDTIYLSISTVIGTKDTGTRDTTHGSGTWSGSAIRRKNTVETTFTSVDGTWDASSPYGFNYNNTPPTYTGSWTVTGSTPSGLTGGGTSSGQRTYYSTDTPP